MSRAPTRLWYNRSCFKVVATLRALHVPYPFLTIAASWFSFAYIVRDELYGATMANGASAPIPPPQFPTHNAPRVWLITSGDSPVGISLARQALEHGDYVVSGIMQADFELDQGRSLELKQFLAEVGRSNGWKERLKIVALDVRYVTDRRTDSSSPLHSTTDG